MLLVHMPLLIRQCYTFDAHCSKGSKHSLCSLSYLVNGLILSKT